MTTLVNPKDGTKIESKLSDSEAYQELHNIKSDFARSLIRSYGKLSESQKFWMHKLANDNRFPVIVQLDSDLEEFVRRFRVLQFRMEYIEKPELGEIKSLGKVKICVGEKILVWSGERCVGRIEKDGFYPSPRCPQILSSQIVIFAHAPIAFLELFGRATGYCCVCGRLLTNEGSVARGIGPICAEEYGL